MKKRKNLLFILTLAVLLFAIIFFLLRYRKAEPERIQLNEETPAAAVTEMPMIIQEDVPVDENILMPEGKVF